MEMTSGEGRALAGRRASRPCLPSRQQVDALPVQQGAAGRHSSRLPLAAPRSYSLTNKVSALACCVRVSFCFNVPGRRPPWLGGGKTGLTRTANGARGMIRKFPLRIQGRKQPGAAKASGLGTRYSQPLTHAGTNGARRCLTSQIGRDGVRSACCGPSRQRRQAGRRTWLRAAVSWAECKKEGQHPAPRRLRRVLPIGCCSAGGGPPVAGGAARKRRPASERVLGRADPLLSLFLLLLRRPSPLRSSYPALSPRRTRRASQPRRTDAAAGDGGADCR